MSSAFDSLSTPIQPSTSATTGARLASISGHSDRAIVRTCWKLTRWPWWICSPSRADHTWAIQKTAIVPTTDSATVCGDACSSRNTVMNAAARIEP